MAYANLNYDDENKPGQAPSLSDNTGQLLTGQGGTGAAPSTGNASSPMQTQEKGGSQFPDISRYLTQNEPGAERLAAKYAGNVSQAGNQARSGIQNLQGAFNTQANAGIVPTDQNLVNRATSNPRSFFNFPQPSQASPPTPQQAQPTPPAPTQQVNQRGRQNTPIPTYQLPYITQQTESNRGRPAPQAQAPVQQPINYQSQVVAPTAPPTVADQAAFNQLQAMRNANYSGPADLVSQPLYQDTLSAAQKAANLSAGVKTDEGRQDFLRSLYGSNVSSPSVARLDNLLLQGHNPASILNKVSGINTGLPGELGAANEAAKAKAQEVSGLDAATKKAVTDALQGTYGGFDTDYQNRLKAAQDATTADYNARALAAHASPGNILQKVGPLNLPTNVATEEDYQKLQALNQLLGSNYGL